MKKILIINGHPDTEGLCHDLADAYEKGARGAGADIRRIDLGRLSFDPVLHHGYRQIQELEPDLIATQEAIRWAEHLVFVFPTWWMGMPALMKGFFDRAYLPGFAFKFHQGKLLPERLLKGKSARLMVTMDSPRIVNWLIYRTSGHLTFERGILQFAGVGPIGKSIFDMVKFASEAKRARWVKKAENLGRRMK